MPERPTFAQLVALEPRLADLLARAKEFRRGRKRISYEAVLEEWYGRRDVQWDRGLRGAVVHLVGFMRKDGDPILHTAAAYDVAYDTIFDALDGRRGRRKAR
jgi:hypothetical protein